MNKSQEYVSIVDPTKKEQELAISRKVMDLLNKSRYNNLEEFILKNANYQSFLNNNHLDTVMKHFGNNLTDEDYNKILENLRSLTKNIQNIENENIEEKTKQKQLVLTPSKDKIYN